MRYRKKPVVIEARLATYPEEIRTLEGVMRANVGDYIITGVRGEVYPCKPDIFAATYEPVGDDEPASSHDCDSDALIRDPRCADLMPRGQASEVALDDGVRVVSSRKKGDEPARAGELSRAVERERIEGELRKLMDAEGPNAVKKLAAQIEKLQREADKMQEDLEAMNLLAMSVIRRAAALEIALENRVELPRGKPLTVVLPASFPPQSPRLAVEFEDSQVEKGREIATIQPRGPKLVGEA